MSLFASGPGATALAAEEQAGLLPNLATRGELNEWERLNILEAFSWAFHPAPRDPLREGFVRELHYRMFDQTWDWAGQYRRTEKNIGIAHHEIREALGVLLGDACYWLEAGSYAADEIAVRFHHRLVSIHPFANGNGRHARLMADLLALRQGREVFSWGAGVLAGDFRKLYIRALVAADRGDLRALSAFMRS